jgi:hypothetical protein
MEFTFDVRQLPQSCMLAIENPDDYAITVNGQLVKNVMGYWIDEDIKTISITDCLITGANIVKLAFDYGVDMEIEDLYLVGDFGTSLIDQNKAIEPGNVTIVSRPNKLMLGSWVGQGLDFYSAAVRYRIPLTHLIRGQRMRVTLTDAACTAAAIHVGTKTFVLPWAPFTADITNALHNNIKEIVVEVIGGRKNILGPLHTPFQQWTGPENFSPDHEQWSREYHLNNHGLMRSVLLETWSE